MRSRREPMETRMRPKFALGERRWDRWSFGVFKEKHTDVPYTARHWACDAEVRMVAVTDRACLHHIRESAQNELVGIVRANQVTFVPEHSSSAITVERLLRTSVPSLFPEEGAIELMVRTQHAWTLPGMPQVSTEFRAHHPTDGHLALCIRHDGAVHLRHGGQAEFPPFAVADLRRGRFAQLAIANKLLPFGSMLLLLVPLTPTCPWSRRLHPEEAEAAPVRHAKGLPIIATVLLCSELESGSRPSDEEVRRRALALSNILGHCPLFRATALSVTERCASSSS